MTDTSHIPDTPALASFIGKWRARWPEWSVAEVFVPRAQRDTALAWAALQQELTDAAWGGSDPRPGEAKLAWWQEELAGWARGARRHPLGSVLQRLPAPWAELASSLPSLAASRERAGDVEQAYAVLQPFAAAVSGVDAVVLLNGEGVATIDIESAQRLIAAALLESRLAHEGDGQVPLSVIARAGEDDPRAIWSRHLLQRWPDTSGALRVRRLWTALGHQRLRQGAASRPLSPWTALRVAWRAARG